MKFSESEVVELKSEVVSDICKEVIAFANTKGGTLYIAENAVPLFFLKKRKKPSDRQCKER